jgi:hypothetical protein
MLRNGKEGISTIPGFSQIQFEGFYRFINNSLAEELDKFPAIKDLNHEIEFQLLYIFTVATHGHFASFLLICRCGTKN